MGSLIDMERSDLIYRCNYVKRSIVWINLIFPPISLAFLIFGVIRMIKIKKRKTFLTNLILIIFFAEILQCISKMLQLVKYCFDDNRNDKNYTDKEHENERSIICQIQIVLAIFSDYCSLLATLLLSLRCYDVIKNKIRFFDKKCRGMVSIIAFVALSFILSVMFLIIDRNRTLDNISYRFDVRDRCSYWCSLEHVTSLCCLALYWLVLFLNIVFACKTICYLNTGYKRLVEESGYIPEKVNDITTPLNKSNPKENNNNNGEDSETYESESGSKIVNLTKEEKKRIEDLRLMKMKCTIYPIVTICYWTFAATYRICDDIFMREFDEGDKPYETEDKEKNFFIEHYIFQKVVQTFFFIYTFLSSIRGIIYGLSFLVFEEKIFFNFFKTILKKCSKKKEPEEEENRLIRNTNSSSNRYSNTNDIKEEPKEGSNNQNIEMNDSCHEMDN